MVAANEPNPILVFDAFNAYQRTAALRGAIELDLFSHIGAGTNRVEELAAAIPADPRGVRILCDYLVVQGFLAKSGDRYALTPTSAAFLDRRSPAYMGGASEFLNSQPLLDAFRDVSELVRRGRSLLPGDGTVQTEFDGWVKFARSMAPLMMAPAQFIAATVDARKSGPVRVLDVAAGHGLFGITVAQQNPAARVTALDWPRVLDVAQENAREAGVAERYELLPGSAFEVDYGEGYDVALLTNILHHFDAAGCRALLKKVAAALAPDGIAITLEFIPDADRVSPPAPAAFAFTMLATTPSGDAYTFDEYDQWWRELGFENNELLDVPQSAQRLVVSSR